MRTKVVLSIATILMLIIGVTAVASNMGFKISLPLVGSNAANWVSLPYFSSYTTAADVWTDLQNSGLSPVQISRYNASIGQFVNYFGRGTAFTLVEGEGILIKVSTASPAPWVVVGSHDPNLTIHFVGSSAANWFSLPYHKTAATAADVWTQLTNANITPVQVTRYNASIGQFVNYFGRGTPFNLVVGEALLIKVSNPTPPSWTPPHY